MSTPTPLPSQFLVNLGNRFAVFGLEGAPPRSAFDPNEHSSYWPRVADEAEVASERIAQSLIAPGFDVERPPSSEMADIVLRQGDRTYLVDVKVRERDPKERDFNEAVRLIENAKATGQDLQVWFVNLERLKTVVVTGDRSSLQIKTFVPWDVWSQGDEGPFTRAYVASRVDDWERRVGAFYDTVRDWVAGAGLTTETTRSMVMSEELMQDFAVTDRNIPILDVLRQNDAVASFVPRGLWTIGSRGRIDLITEQTTRMIVDLSADEGKSDWQLVSAESRRDRQPFTRQVFLDLVGVA